jgi:hypothetical protein
LLRNSLLASPGKNRGANESNDMPTNRILAALAALHLLATASDAGQLIAIDNDRTLYRISTATGAKTMVGIAAANSGIPGALARDPVSGNVYLSSSSNDALYRLDLATGGATFIGGYGTTTVVMLGLEWDNVLGSLWGASNGNLFSISPGSGVASAVGTSGLSGFTNLVYVPETDSMYATNNGIRAFYSVNRTTGVMTLIGPLGAGSTNPGALAYDTDNGVIYMVDGTSDNLYTINVLSGAATVVGSTGTGNLVGLVYLPGTSSFTSFCPGDGSGTGCPCANSGAPGNGCANSLNPAGALMQATGTPSVSNDTVILQGTGMPNSSALFFQGTAQQGAGGAGAQFGDGLRCAAGSVIRLGTKFNAGGASQYPGPGDPSVSVRGLCFAGNSRTYQVWYRNAAAFCTSSTFNLTNGIACTWEF